MAAPNAPPRIVRIWLSTLTIEPGTWFDGTILVSTNVASVEVRTAAFSINSAHVAPGIYRFHTHVLELPPLSRRHSYELYIIARNTPGVERSRRGSAAGRMSAAPCGLLAFPVVVMYHRVDVAAPTDVISQKLTVSPAQFAEELRSIHRMGLHTIGIAELARDMATHESPAARGRC